MKKTSVNSETNQDAAKNPTLDFPDLTTPAFNELMIAKRLTYLEQHYQHFQSHPAAKNIFTLLGATKLFISQTEPGCAHIRVDQAKTNLQQHHHETNQLYKNPWEENWNKLITTWQLAMDDVAEPYQKTVNELLIFCKKCINERVAQLSKIPYEPYSMVFNNNELIRDALEIVPHQNTPRNEW